MNTGTRLLGYGAGLAVVFCGAIGVGRLAGPVGATTEHTAQHEQHETSKRSVEMPGGLQVSENGYTLTPETTTVKPGVRTDFRFSVRKDGRPVTAFTEQHEKKLHFIIVRRDLSGFQHLHPVEAANGTWSVPLTLPAAGDYRAYADFAPAGGEALTLGVDVHAAGDYRPQELPKPSRTATVDGYQVTLKGDVTAGKAGMLTLTVSKDGRPVTDLQPYLGAYGHLVALRDGDLAYLHVHPEEGRPGPDIAFHAEVPTPGAYRLYLDFQHDGKVRTAEFTVEAR